MVGGGGWVFGEVGGGGVFSGRGFGSVRWCEVVILGCGWSGWTVRDGWNSWLVDRKVYAG